MRFNQILHREPHQSRRQNEGQIEGLTLTSREEVHGRRQLVP